jgi:hypothetical protein
VHFLALRHDLVELVVGLVDRLGGGAGQQVLELELDHGGAAAGFVVFGFLHDERVIADHDDVAGAEFLGDFHEFASREWDKKKVNCSF